jgi:hypothetical protein
LLHRKRGFTPENIARVVNKPRPEPPAPPPPPEPKPAPRVQVHLELGTVVRAAGWAWDRYSKYKDSLEADEQKVLELAYQHYGWLTLPQVMEGLGFSHRRTMGCLGRLIERHQCQEMQGRNGHPLYVFPEFLPVVAECPYCDGEVMPELQARCQRCGAPCASN